MIPEDSHDDDEVNEELPSSFQAASLRIPRTGLSSMYHDQISLLRAKRRDHPLIKESDTGDEPSSVHNRLSDSFQAKVGEVQESPLAQFKKSARPRGRHQASPPQMFAHSADGPPSDPETERSPSRSLIKLELVQPDGAPSLENTAPTAHARHRQNIERLGGHSGVRGNLLISPPSGTSQDFLDRMNRRLDDNLALQNKSSPSCSDKFLEGARSAGGARAVEKDARSNPVAARSPHSQIQSTYGVQVQRWSPSKSYAHRNVSALSGHTSPGMGATSTGTAASKLAPTHNKYLKRLSQQSFVPPSRRGNAREQKQYGQPDQQHPDVSRSLRLGHLPGAPDISKLAKQRNMRKSHDLAPLASFRHQKKKSLLIESADSKERLFKEGKLAQTQGIDLSASLDNASLAIRAAKQNYLQSDSYADRLIDDHCAARHTRGLGRDTSQKTIQLRGTSATSNSKAVLNSMTTPSAHASEFKHQ